MKIKNNLKNQKNNQEKNIKIILVQKNLLKIKNQNLIYVQI